jgi:hypothetical protein
MVRGVENKRRQVVALAKDFYVGHGVAEPALCVFMDKGAD